MLLLLLICIICVIYYIKFKNYVPILMYHRIADIPGDRNSLPKEKFEQQLLYLSSHNYTAITPDMLYEHYKNNAPLPPKPVLLTFDDGYADNYSEALPLLKKYHMTAVVFPIANWIGKPNHWEHFGKKETMTMTLPQLQDWLKQGMDIQPHTHNHPFLANCDDNKLHDELAISKQQLTKLLDKPMNYICYPYGNFNQKVMRSAKDVGYKMAFAIFESVPLWHINLFALPRIPIPSHQKMWEFKLKVSSINVLFVAMRKWERDFKRIKRKFMR